MANHTLPADAVHVWWSPLATSSTDLERFWSVLSADERARADRFVFDRDRAAYVRARGQLRRLLGEYLEVPAADVIFAYALRGKPALGGALSAADLRFNVSHTRGLAVYAFSRSRDVGVDVEQVRADMDLLGVANQVFPEREVAILRELDADAQVERFFTLWTVLESSVKATGAGLASDTRAITLSNDFEQAHLPPFGTTPISSWSVRKLELGDGYAAAIAVEGTDWQLRVRRLESA